MHQDRQYRLLLVDDDEVDREAVQRCLDEAGSAVVLETAADSEIGLARLGEDHWDCVLLDYRFPDGDAFDLFEHVLKQSCAQRPPVVLLTGLRGERVAVEAMKRGAQDYLNKGDITPDLLVRTIDAAIEKAALQRALEARDDKLRRLSLHDALTGLANRTLFIDRLDQCIRVAERNGEPFAVLMMDLDRFKQVNDSMGHEAGDEVLRGVATRMAEHVRQSDTIARMGGDEFAAVLAATGDLAGARVVAQKICAALEQPFPLEGAQAEIGVSVGVALWPVHGRDRVTLLRHADGAMYEAKRGGGGITVHGSRASPADVRASLIVEGLERAVDAHEFMLCYQPQLDLDTGEVVGAEALLRWRHPDLGLLPPMDFIPSAERSAVIRPMTLQVVDRALRDLVEWRAAGLRIGTAVNVAPRLLRDSALVDEIGSLLAGYGVSPGLLTLELSETRMGGSMTQTEHGLAAMKTLGVRVAIDDFGTGFTSLQHLRTLPVDEIKIDEAFIEGMGDDDRNNGIVRSILQLGQGFGVRVIAEGVESDATWRCLQTLGCGHGQGYRFSHPLPSAQFVAWCREWQRGGVPATAPARGPVSAAGGGR